MAERASVPSMTSRSSLRHIGDFRETRERRVRDRGINRKEEDELRRPPEPSPEHSARRGPVAAVKQQYEEAEVTHAPTTVPSARPTTP